MKINTVNPILLADSYKFSQPPQYPKNAKGYFGYLEARRSSIPGITHTQFFGLQMFIKEYLMNPITKRDIDEAEEVCNLHGTPFTRDIFEIVLNEYHGFFPLTVKAVKEGSNVEVGNALLTVECTDPRLFSLGSFIETALLRGVWYPITVSTVSKYCKNIISESLKLTCDNPEAELPFKLHDFGPRGASSFETAGIGGLAHLVNFQGTDNFSGVLNGRKYYNCNMAGFSIPASEHSTITSWGKENEVAAYSNMIDQFGKPGAVFACVSDSYDIFNACSQLWGTELKQKVIDSGATLVIRPDSGEPLETITKVMNILDEKFGSKINSKGYKVLNNVRVIQGDGVNPEAIKSILYGLQLHRFSAENIAFGMGGALLQSVNRDTFSFAMKCSSILIGDSWVDVYKDPVGGGKTSKKGRLALVKGTIKELNGGVYGNKNSYVTITEERAKDLGLENQLEVVYQNGKLVREQTLDEIRAISNT